MTASQHRQRRISIPALSLFLLGAAYADGALAQNPQIFLNANVQLTRLHPDVKTVILQCSAPLANGQSKTGNSVPQTGAVANRALNKTLSAVIGFTPTDLADPANRTVNVTCRLEFSKGNYNASVNPAFASPTAAQATSILPSNWTLVATGSTVSWTQAVTFPNIAP